MNVSKIKITVRNLPNVDNVNLNKMLYKNDYWLTNGHWLVRRSAVNISENALKRFQGYLKPAKVGKLLDLTNKRDIFTVLKKQDSKSKYKPQERIIFKAKEKEACFDEKYIKLFKIEKLEGLKSVGAFFAFKKKKVWFAIMSCIDDDLASWEL